MKTDKVNKNVERIIERLGMLTAPEFIGICKLLGVKIYEGDVCAGAINETKEQNQERTANIKIRKAEDLIPEVIEKINNLNRVQRRNLWKVINSATKGR